MATISGLNLTASKATTPAGEKCCLAYTYNIIWDTSDPGDSAQFNVSCEIWHGGQWHHSILAGPAHDSHTIQRKTPMPVCRILEFPCDVVDEIAGQGLILRLAIKTGTPQGEFLYEAATTLELEGEL